jgi:hypothetical protein
MSNLLTGLKIALLALLIPTVASAGGYGGRGPDPGGERYGCYVSFFKYRDGRGPELTRFGPEQIYDLDDLHYRHGEDLDGDVLSVATGPGTWIELYDHKGFKVSLYRIGPDSAVNLRSKIVDSYRITCQPPRYW